MNGIYYKARNVSGALVTFEVTTEQGLCFTAAVEDGQTLDGLDERGLSFIRQYVDLGLMIIEEESDVANWQEEGF